ncbi:MAG TPA: nucleotidyltransferase domain-containing protein [Caldisericia bacterium]|nr:nucleotidyltransferase domain-containing protein [Caldisericia bacterium]
MKIIVKSIFGSQLYGTNSENSDTDVKGIYLPSLEDCLLNQISNTINTTSKEIKSAKNTKDDIDTEIFSLQYFMKLALNGEMIVSDLLHAPENMLIETSSIWIKLRNMRSEFYSKNLFGYLGYIRKQTARYCVKGERLKAMKEVLNILSNDKLIKQNYKLNKLWDKLPINEYCQFVKNDNEKRFEQYQCCGKLLQPTMSCEYAYNIVKEMYNSYGERAKQAETNEGIDWKAVSHAFRVGLQLKEIYETGDLIYPLKEREFIKDIKYGKFHYKNDKIGEKLDDLLLEVEKLSKNSKYPDKINKEKLDKFILDCY